VNDLDGEHARMEAAPDRFFEAFCAARSGWG
jgi:hypothetical protein